MYWWGKGSWLSKEITKKERDGRNWWLGTTT